MERVVDADMLHEVEVEQEVAEDALDRRYGGKDGVVEAVRVVEDW